MAGEQGPSCHTMEQIPNIKLIHIRFLDRPGSYRNIFSLKGDDDNDSDGDDDILKELNQHKTSSTAGGYFYKRDQFM